MPRFAMFAVLVAAVALTGCAHYEYDIVEPADLAQHVGSKSSVPMPMEPVRYEAISSSDRLVLVIHNETDQPIKLLGEDSFAVDPHGESHPIPTRTIAPASATKLFFPPVRPTFRQSGPSLGFGVGGVVSSGHVYHGGGAGYHYGHAFYDDYPRYYRAEDDGTIYWDWTGDRTDMRLRLSFAQGEKTFHHDFTFRRVKV